MTREEAKEVFINRGYVNVKGGTIFDGDKWRQSVEVITEWLKEQPCTDAISRQEAIEWMENIRSVNRYYHPKGNDDKTLVSEVIDRLNQLPSVSTEKTDAYKQGWHDAITTALKETHSVLTEEGHFRVVQEETLIGVGMAYEQVSTEKTGRWIWNDGVWKFMCSVCKESVNPMPTCMGEPMFKYCPCCGSYNGGGNNGNE